MRKPGGGEALARITFASEAAYLDYFDAAGRMFDAIWEVADESRGRQVAELLARFADNQPEQLSFPAAIALPAALVGMARDVLGEMIMPGSAGEVAMLSDGGAVAVED